MTLKRSNWWPLARGSNCRTNLGGRLVRRARENKPFRRWVLNRESSRGGFALRCAKMYRLFRRMRR